jgi:hypothetical protein
LRGEIVRGPVRGPEHAFVAVEDWLGARPEPLDRPDALARLARRYLRGHGPATAGDLARWAGITLGDARRALDGIRDMLVEWPDGLIDLADRERAAPLPKPRLLGPFDPLLLGWASRAPFVGTHRVVTTNGIIRACILVDGRVVGTWTLNGPTLSVAPLEDLAPVTVRAVRKDADDVLRFLGRPDNCEIVFET